MGENGKLRVGIIIGVEFDEGLEYTSKVIDLLIEHGAEVFLSGKYKSSLKSDENVKFLTKDSEAFNEKNNIDIIIVIGGDGTILSKCELAAQSKKPILGINLSLDGFLSSLNRNELDELSKIFKNEYTIEERPMEEIIIHDGGISREYCAINDIVISAGAMSRLAKFDIQLSRKKESRFEIISDGIIISTPTGSTSYSLSAGGPLIDPKTDVICVNAICPLSLATRPIILSGNSVLQIKGTTLSSATDNIQVIFDGKTPIELSQESTITVSKSSLSTQFIRFNADKFYDTISNKMFK